MLELPTRPDPVRDLPVCFPGRACVDETPVGAHLIGATSALTPVSPAIAAGCFLAIGAALVVIALGLRLQWRGSGARPWLVVLAVALVPTGVVTAWAIGGRIDAVRGIYAGEDGRPSAPVPSSLIGAWPLVVSAGEAMAVLGALALFLILNTAAIRERRAAALRRSAPPATGSSAPEPSPRRRE